MAQERLQKLLAQAGIASRRSAEDLIAAGRVRVNGRVVREPGTRADLHKDKVEVDGRRLVAERPAYYLLNKPREMVTTLKDPEGRANLSQVLSKVPERLFPVGRLDYHTSGALLVTNDGEMADALLHPTHGVPKLYIAKVKGPVEEEALGALRNGVVLDDGYKTAKAEVFVAREDRGNSWLSITIREGKNRQIHRMGEAVGHRVMRLTRVEFAGLSVEGLRPGALRPLTTREVDKLKKDYLNPKKRRKASAAQDREAAANAGHFEGWGEDVVDEPWGDAETPRAPRRATAANKSRVRATGQERSDAGGGGARLPTRRSASEETTPRGNPAAQRAVRVLSEARAAPASRSIGGGKAAERPVGRKAGERAAPRPKVGGRSKAKAEAVAKGAPTARAAKARPARPQDKAGSPRREGKPGARPARGEGRTPRKAPTRAAGQPTSSARREGKADARPAKAGGASAASRKTAPRAAAAKPATRGAARGATGARTAAKPASRGAASAARKSAKTPVRKASNGRSRKG